MPQSTKNKFKWKQQNVDFSRIPQTPTGLFELFLDDDVIELLVQNSMSYAGLRGNHQFQTTPEEMRVFLAILLISGYSRVPRRRLYWSNDEDVQNDAIQSAMTRDRFDEFMRYIHVSDNVDLDPDDKMAKVRPLLSILNDRFLCYFPKQQNLSIDESMIPYYGRHGAKQFIRGKPIRFGFKIWALTTPLGYVVQFEPYQGKRGQQASNQKDLGMGGAVVTDLLSELQKEDAYHVTFDNLFTSLKLVDKLSSLGVACTGTIRANRVENCPLKALNVMKKTARGTYDHAYDANKELIVVRWNDNSIVSVASNKYGIQPLQHAARWSRKDGERVRVEQPFLIHHYNQTMGGVDRLDQNVDKYRIGIRSKKWWWAIFAYCIDVCVQQAWHLYRGTTGAREQPLDLLGVRRAIVQVYLARGRRNVSPGRPRGRPASLSKRCPDDVRLDRIDHMITTNNTQRRCVFCGMKTKRACAKCNVALHDRCFRPFHI